MSAIQCQLAEALSSLAKAEERNRELEDALEMMYDKWENGDPCTENGDPYGSAMGTCVNLSCEEEESVLRLIPKEHTEKIKLNDGKLSWQQRAESAESELFRLREENRNSYADGYAQAVQDHRKLDEENRWISVEDKLPPEIESGYTYQYLCVDFTGKRLICMGRYSATSSRQFYWIGNYEKRVTHWRPLPSGPIDAKKEGE